MAIETAVDLAPGEANLKQAYDSLALQERDGLVRFARGMLADEHEAEDAAHEALLRLYQAGDQAIKPRAYLYKTIANLCMDRLRQRSRPSPPAPSPAENADRLMLAERSAAVRSALDELPGEERAAVLLREVERISYAEIAESLDATVPQVTNWIHRGKNRLRRLLAPYVEEA